MEMLHSNCVIAEEIFAEINRYNKDAIIIVVTNPLDVITMKIQQVSGRDPHKVIGTGTLLDSARLVRVVADLLELSDLQIIIWVVGEHGASAVALLSSAMIMGMPLNEYLKSVTNSDTILNAESLERVIKKEGFRIHDAKGYTSTGVLGVAASVPSIIGKNGIEDIRQYMMTEEEREAFLASVDTIRQASKSEGNIAAG